MSIHYDTIEKVISNTNYIANLSEDIIFDAYKEIINSDHARKFDNFN